MTPMKFCPKCNSQYDDGVVFCTRDGSPLKSNPGSATLKSPGMTLSSGRGSALGSSALRTNTPRHTPPRPGPSNAALALSLDRYVDQTPADGLTREVEITPQHPQRPPEEDIVPGSELDPYADSPTLAIAAPFVTVSYPPDGPPRPRPTAGLEPGRPVAPQPAPVNGTKRSPTLPEPMAGDTTPPSSTRDGTPPEGTFGGEPEEPDLSGQTVAGRYRVIRRLGEGGMGVVYQAIDERLEKAVAVKVLKEDFSKRQDVVARFTQEAKSAARIKHENVLDVTDYGKTEAGSYYIAMELLVGTDLADVLQKGEPITVERAADIAVQICRALSAAHGLGVVHRDMKPENVFLLRSNEGREVVKIVDFGIAQMKDSAGGENTRKLTRTGMIFGTPEYMSPEQASGKQIDHRVDVYATGVILYEMFAGRVPFVGDTFMGVLTQHMFEAPPPIAELNPASNITPEFSAVIYKALAKDPNQRYASMGEFSEDLMRVRGGAHPSAPGGAYSVGNALRGPTGAPATSPSGPGSAPGQATPWTQSVGAAGTMEADRPRRRSLAPVIAVAVVAIVGAIALAFALGSQSNPPREAPPVAPPARTPPPRVVTPPRPVTPPAVQPPVVVPAPVVTPTPPTHELVTLSVVTVPPGAQVRGEPIARNGVTFTCVTPCTEHVPARVSMRLTATRAGRRGSVVVDPVAAMPAVSIPLEVVRAHPTQAATTPVQRPAQRRCGVTDPDTGLLIPCFNRGSNGAH
ncbi:MAG: serine/threonine-protein kinase [Deltaproteobacteria bacterium]|nr:serine/threonine-protein kinase [Myxococcales bacterium]MDP3213541.1 serine/threonine-protein kinase [Deltaproteobacteria bacterium]